MRTHAEKKKPEAAATLRAYIELAASHGLCATCGGFGPVFSVVVPLDTDPEIYDRLYTARFCLRHAHAQRESLGRTPLTAAPTIDDAPKHEQDGDRGGVPGSGRVQ